MSINIWTDSMQHAALLGKPVLFTNWLIQRDIIPDGWYCYDLRGTHKSPSTRTTVTAGWVMVIQWRTGNHLQTTPNCVLLP